MNKKILIWLTVFISLVNIVNADIFSTIAMTGLSFVNPTAAAVVNGVLCITGPAGLVTCATNYVDGKIIGQVQSTIIQEIAKISPEAAKSIITYNQIKGYIDEGATIINELKLNENGVVEKGDIRNLGKNGAYIGNWFGLQQQDVFVQNVDVTLDKESGNTITFSKDDGRFWVKRNPFENIKKQDKDVNAFIKIDNNGKIIEADFTTNEKGGTYKFNNFDSINVPGNSHVIYKDGIINVIQNENSESSYLNHIIKGKEFFIKDKEISCMDCSFGEFKLKNAVLEIKDDGYFLDHGEAEYKEILLSSDDELFITHKKTDYSGNYLVIEDKSIEINSKDGRINIKVLSDNKILNTIEENKERLMFIVEKGDNIKIFNRNEEGLIPKIDYKSSEKGNTRIVNRDILFTIDKNRIYFNKAEDYKNFPSVPFELQDKDNILIVDTNGQLKDNGGSVTYNNFLLPITNRLKDDEYKEYISYLKHDEYILPNEVFDAYSSIVDPNIFVKITGRPIGGYNRNNFLGIGDRKEKFINEINKLGYDEDDSEKFYDILSTRGNIIFKNSILKDKFFEEALPHERFHKEMDFLNKRDLEVLHDIYNQLIFKDYPFEEARKIGISEQEILDQKRYQEILLEQWRKANIPEEEIQKEVDRKFNKIELVKDKSGNNFRRVSALMNWNEFYPYLAQGEYRQQVEGVLKKEYPKAYKIFIDIKKKTQLDHAYPAIR